jgi:hypothetical protein
VRSIEIGCALLFLLCVCIVPEVCADSKKIPNPVLSCKYFDSMSTDRNSCKSLNRGRKIEIKPEGEHKSLHRTAIKLLASSEDGRKDLEASGGIISFETWMVDLNGDGIEEAILFTPGSFRGASGNGDIIVFRLQREKAGSHWKPIGFLLGSNVHIERITSNQYYSLVTSWLMGAEYGFLTRYTMNVRTGRYLPSKETEYFCSLKSVEPCFHSKEPPTEGRPK